MPDDRQARVRPAAEIAMALRCGTHVGDYAFDALLPPEARQASARFWSPVRVAVIAAKWLEHHGARRVLDVGAGIGKFCTIAAIVSEITFDGIERRAALVEQAAGLASALGVAERTTFVHGELDAAPLDEYDALYLYNPFWEAAQTRRHWLDESIELTPDRGRDDIARIEAALHTMPIGAQVITYHGFGGVLPDSFHLRRAWALGGGMLRCWQKLRHQSSGRVLVEDDWM